MFMFSRSLLQEILLGYITLVEYLLDATSESSKYFSMKNKPAKIHIPFYHPSVNSIIRDLIISSKKFFSSLK